MTLEKRQDGSKKAAMVWDQQWDLLLASLICVNGQDIKKILDYEPF